MQTNIYTTKEVAEILKTTPSRVTALVRSGKLVAVTGLREYRFTDKAINDYLNGCTTEGKKRAKRSPEIPLLKERRQTKKELQDRGEWISVRR